MSSHLPFIVAEVSSTWREDETPKGPLLSQRLQEVILFNAARGYELDSWQITSAAYQYRHFEPPEPLDEHADDDSETHGGVLEITSAKAAITETIVAVFRRKAAR